MKDADLIVTILSKTVKLVLQKIYTNQSYFVTHCIVLKPEHFLHSPKFTQTRMLSFRYSTVDILFTWIFLSVAALGLPEVVVCRIQNIALSICTRRTVKMPKQVLNSGSTTTRGEYQLADLEMSTTVGTGRWWWWWYFGLLYQIVLA